jgi:hypothetical protein
MIQALHKALTAQQLFAKYCLAAKRFVFINGKDFYGQSGHKQFALWSGPGHWL